MNTELVFDDGPQNDESDILSFMKSSRPEDVCEKTAEFPTRTENKNTAGFWDCSPELDDTAHLELYIGSGAGDFNIADPDDSAVMVNTPTASPISFQEAVDLCRHADLETYRSKVQVTAKLKGLKWLTNKLFGPPNIRPFHLADRDTIFLLTQWSYSDGEHLHGRTLNTIYKMLVGSYPNSRYGGHWEDIGFQGNDPATDLRGCGYFGLLQLLYITTSTTHGSFTDALYATSLDPVQNFPLCVLSLNVSRIALNALRHGRLNTALNRSENVFDIICTFYAGLLTRFLQIWVTGKKTIVDTGFVIKSLERESRSKVGDLMAMGRSPEVVTSLAKNGGRGPVEFSDLGFSDLSESVPQFEESSSKRPDRSSRYAYQES